MTLLFILFIVILAALGLVSAINQVQRRERARRMEQRQLRLQIELLEEVMDCLLQTLPNRQIAKHVNDEILELLQNVLRLERRNPVHIETSIKNADNRGNELVNQRSKPRTSYLKDSDIQIAQAQLHLNKAAQVLRHQHLQGRMSKEELEVYLLELNWAHLMVSVVSFIGQGYKASARGDIFSAQAFYKKAQHLLIESTHPDTKRMRMIRELGETIAGTRKTLSEDLLPEDTALA
jgi:tetratricopeptide (TPR) repeat protein